MHPVSLRRGAAAAALIALCVAAPAQAQHHPAPAGPVLLTADRVFDGERMRTGVGVLVRDGKVAAVGAPAALRAPDVREIARPGGTILPGFIDLHTHHTFNGVPPARVLDGTDLAHVEIPHGIDAQELHLMLGAGMTTTQVLRAATSWAGAHLGQGPLGKLVAGAPADVIVVAGDPSKVLKTLEYPYVVLSAGTPIVEKPLPASAGGGHGHG